MPVDDPDLDAAAARYAAELPEQLDLVHLGLGEDGHTASLVPGDPVLGAREHLVAVTREYQGRQRMTLTYPALARAREIVWLVTGESKRDPLAKLLAGDKSLPAARIVNENQLVVADAAAVPSDSRAPPSRRGRGACALRGAREDASRPAGREVQPRSSCAAARSMSTPSSRSSTAARSFAEWMSFVASSVSIVLEGEVAVRGRPVGLAQVVAVREAGARDRGHAGAVLDPLREAREHVPQGRVHRRSRPAGRLLPHEVVVALPDRRADEPLGVGGRLLGEQPAVDAHLAERRNHVPLVRRVDHRRRQRQREKRLDERGQQRMHVVRPRERLLDRGRLAEHRLEEAARLGDHLPRRHVRAERVHVASRLDERVVRDPGHRGVAAPAVHAYEERRRHLLRRRAQVHRAPVQDQPRAAALVDRVVAAGGVRMGLDEPDEPVPVRAAHLLVGDRQEHEVAGGLEPFAHERGERHRGRRGLVLHVERAAPPHLPVDEVARPGIPVPLGWVGEHGVRVREEQERGPVAAA